MTVRITLLSSLSDRLIMKFNNMFYHYCLSKERRLETLQNQTLRHVAEVFKRVNIETLKTETYTSSLHVHLNMLQNKIMLHS